MKHKKLFISLISVCSVFVVLAVFLFSWFCCDYYGDFKGFKKEIAIPGLKDGAVPQGIGNYADKYEETSGESAVTGTQQYYFISCYMLDGSPSRVYVVGEKTGELGYFTIKYPDGTLCTGHCGGVATDGQFLWVANDGEIICIKYSGILEKAKAKESVDVNATFDANCNASFCSFDGTYFYAGEFYRKGNYETNELHHFTTPTDGEGKGGAQHKAVCYRYRVRSTTEYGLITTTVNGKSVPAIYKAFSLPEKIQGIAFTDDAIVLSQSWGLSNSRILVYDKATATRTGNYGSSLFKAEDGQRCDLYYLDNRFLSAEYSIPCMSEGLCNIKNRVFVLFESAGKKYKTFVREQLPNVYSFRPTINN